MYDLVQTLATFNDERCSINCVVILLRMMAFHCCTYVRMYPYVCMYVCCWLLVAGCWLLEVVTRKVRVRVRVALFTID